MTLRFLPAVARRLGLVAGGAATLLAGSAQPVIPCAVGALRCTAFDHRAFDGLLHAHVVGGLVDYDAFGSSPEFRAYLAALAAFDPTVLSRNDQLAFWINAYNAYTIELINHHHERRSIRNINKSLGFLKLKGPWSEPLARVGGHAYTLDEIEHDIIRRRFGEPRIHFALVCAAMGCPPLRSEAYIGARLSPQLDDQGRIFLRESPAKNRIEPATRTVYVSLIFNRYKADFGGSDAAVGRFIARWYDDGAEKSLLESGHFTTTETRYDWTLNSLSGQGSRR
ncbi:MAG: DUF547 domain-containing protein [Gemmatimonadaceae bacterium]